MAEEPEQPSETPQDDDAEIDVEALLLEARRRDGRYRLAAYRFVLGEGIEYTMREHLNIPRGEYRHMTGREIAEGLRGLALREFGPLAYDVWKWWGVTTTRDWGEVIFNMIAVGLLNANDDDRPEDFDNIYDVREALSSANVR